MLWYYLFPIFIIVFAWAGYKKKITGIWILFILLFFSMFRGAQVGNDTRNYIDNVGNSAFIYNYYSIEESFDLGYNDIIFYYVSNLIQNSGLSSRLIVYYLSTITLLFLYLGAKRYKVNLSLFLMFFVLMSGYLLSLNVARQMSAVSIAFYASSFLLEEGRKKHLFWLWMLFAFFTHSSSIVCLLLYPLKFIHLDRRKTGVFVFLLSFIGIFFPLTSYVFNIFVNIPFFNSFYEDYGLQSSNYGVGQVSFVGIVYKIVLLVVCYKSYQGFYFGPKTNLLDNLFLLSVLINGIFAAEANLATTRIKYYFLIYQCLYFAFFFYGIKEVKYKQIIFSFLAIIQYLLIINISMGYNPYSLDFSL